MFLGNTDKNLQLNFESGTEAYGSCGGTLNGQFWLIGGKNHFNQVNLITRLLHLANSAAIRSLLR